MESRFTKYAALDDDLARRQVEMIDAKVLSNRKPPYPIVGGLFDALKDTGGDVLSVTNEEGRAAQKLFLESEGIDIHPASAIAVASLVNAANNGTVSADDLIMLNITGGGEARFKSEKEFFYLKPQCIFDLDPKMEDVAEQIESLFKIKVLVEKTI